MGVEVAVMAGVGEDFAAAEEVAATAAVAEALIEVAVVAVARSAIPAQVAARAR